MSKRNAKKEKIFRNKIYASRFKDLSKHAREDQKEARKAKFLEAREKYANNCFPLTGEGEYPAEFGVSQFRFQELLEKGYLRD
jgi:hypothetical protein